MVQHASGVTVREMLSILMLCVMLALPFKWLLIFSIPSDGLCVEKAHTGFHSYSTKLSK